MNSSCSLVISGSHVSTVGICDVRVGPITELKDSKDAITAVASARFAILASSVDGKLREYDIRQSCMTVDSFAAPIVGIELSGDEQTVLVARLDSKVELFVKPTAEVIQTYQGHSATKYAVRAHFGANDGVVVSGSESGEVVIWEAVEGSVERRVKFGEGPILDVAVQKPFVELAVGSANGDVGVFRMGDGGKEESDGRGKGSRKDAV
jgi:WD40 repeat protein